MESICAITTALGGAVGVIRVSGDDAFRVCGRVWRGRTSLEALPERQLSLGMACSLDGGMLDAECLAVRMPGPRSYTGEDVVELQCHGGALCVRRVLEALLAAGCRMAEAGEFTKRAFLNGRLELTQAEAVADVIEAGSDAALGMAARQLQGRLGRRVNESYEALSDILAEVESRLDFPEEELDWRSAEEMSATLSAVRGRLSELLSTRHAGEVLRGGLGLAIVGCPNVGKSSLLNYLLGRDRAIVTAIPGTTRDTIEERVSLRGIPVRLVDTAGIRESGDVIERTGMERARASAEAADVVLWVFDASRPYGEQAWPGWDVRGQVALVGNKRDLGMAETVPGAVYVSVKTGDGMSGLYDAVERLAGTGCSADSACEVAVAARHAALLQEALDGLALVDAHFQGGEWELAAIGLRSAVAALGRIVGREVEPDVLAAIFSRFCIGK